MIAPSVRRISQWLAPSVLGTLSLAALGSLVLAGPLRPSIDLMDSLEPPALFQGGSWAHPLGTDGQGRDLFVALIEATRLSLGVAGMGVVGALAVGLAIGLAAGQRGGVADALAMRAADIQLSFPALLVALLADGALRLGSHVGEASTAGRSLLILGVAIALGRWAPIARLVRAATRREALRDYVAAARLAGASAARVLALHVAPNIIGPVLAFAALDVGLAIMDETTLSYLGLGLPADRPSLGTLLRDGQDVMLAGAWWAVAVPGIVMIALVGCAVLGADGLRVVIARGRP